MVAKEFLSGLPPSNNLVQGLIPLFKSIVKSEAGKFNLRVSSMAVANTISVGHGSEKT